MRNEQLFVEVGYNSINKNTEELCGDKVEVFQSEDRTIIVLADGLGSGVKANILATLTSKIAITMLKKGADIEQVIETIVDTLPVCKVRKIAYSTFSIIEIDKDMNCKIFESENPPFFFVRDKQILELDKKISTICNKNVSLTEVKLQENDILYVCSDGVIHAGVGKKLNFGWQWEHVANYVQKEDSLNAELLSRRLLTACDDLYEHTPGDDTTIVTVKIRKPLNILVFTGPPLNKELDNHVVNHFMSLKGKKIVCGGTATNIVSRELKRKVETNIEYFDAEIPPAGKMDGFEMVTEGVVTLRRVIELLKRFAKNEVKMEELGKDAASEMTKMLVQESTHIDFWVGKAINYAHQSSDFPRELSVKLTLIYELVKVLKQIGKVAEIHYVAEVNYESV